MTEIIKGFTDGEQFRKANQYNKNQKRFEKSGLTPEMERVTPTVGINIAHLMKMESVQRLRGEITGQSLSTTILGISTAEGPRDFQRLLKGLGAGHISTTAIDISDGIFDQIRQTGLDEVTCLLRDARKTGLPSNSQDINLRDHIGNCCPPEIDRAINREATRILKPDGISIVNITTSDLLLNSQQREKIPFLRLKDELGNKVIHALQNKIYDLEGFKEMFPEIDSESLRGMILEIEPKRSFVVFGEDPQGHGEWFRRLEEHKRIWQKDGFEIVEVATREGTDSHEPPLKCLRHNVVLRKKVTSLNK